MTGRDVLSVAQHRMGFLSEEDIADLARDPATRLTPVLVRCGGCRFSAPAQDVAHLIGIIDRDGKEYVRDVSLAISERMITPHA